MKYFDSSCSLTAFQFKLTVGLPICSLRALLSLAAFLAVGLLWGQAPDRISYQAVVRDMNNDLIANTQIGVRITILQGSAGGANVYRERHAPTTSAAGLVSLQIGGGSVQNGSLAAINWSAGPYFVEQAIDLTGGTNYSLASTTELLSVPYALYAKRVNRAGQVAVADTAASVSNAGLLGLSVGTVLLFGGDGAAVPPGWLLCNGAVLNESTYPALHNLIGDTYSSVPGQVRVPDLRGRGPMGRDPSQTEFADLGQMGGSKTHMLTIPEMPGHNHEGVTGLDGNHRHSYITRFFLVSGAAGGQQQELGAGGGPNDAPFQTTQFAGTHSHTISTQGGGGAHKNLQPYLTVNFIIKAN